ncbi:MAG TPA: hypothetical protein VKG82_04535 [Solirubrobacteraceae bacterium]|nr:hypothetical protein [Solirubrobacteraceae bacterium]
MGSRPYTEDYGTAWSYWQARRAWVRRHGGSLLGTFALAIGFGLLTGSALVLVILVAAALLGTAYARSRP